MDVLSPATITLAVAFAAALSAAGVLTALRSPAVLADVNERSSHSTPTPRTGGLAVIGAYLATTALIAAIAPGVRGDLSALATLAAATCAFGLIDDVMSLPALGKFLVQTAFAVLAAYGLGSFETLPTPFGALALGAFGAPVTALWIVAFMNVFNFMDGLNGMAAGAATVGGAALGAAALIAGEPAAGAAFLVVAAASAGFAPFNVGGGRIFLGDNGSQAIAFVLAAAAAMAEKGSAGGFSMALAPLVFAPFIFDAAWTLARRTKRRARLSEAHKEHLYQRLNQAGWSHGAVSGLFAAMIGVSAAVAIAASGLGGVGLWLAALALATGFALTMMIAFRATRRQ